MNKLTLASTCLISLLALPLAAQADDFTITNNTDAFGTIKIGYSPCSSNLGSSGIVSPHEVHVFSHTMMKMFCGSSCTAYIYPNNNCNGKEMGTAKIDSKVGVVSYTNNDEEHFVVSGSGFNFTIDPANQGFKYWLSSLIKRS